MNKHLSRLARALLSLVIIVGLVLFARTVKWGATWAAIRDANRWVLIAAALVNLASLAIKGVRWWIFLRPVGANSLWLAIRATVAGAGLNNILVANGGEAARVVFVARSAHIQSAKILATLALERLFELIGYFILLAAALSFLDLDALPASIARLRPVAWLFLVGMGVLLTYLVRRPEAVHVPANPGAGWRSRLAAYMRHFLQTMGTISTGPRFMAALVLSVGIWALQLWTYSLTARAANFNFPLVGTVAAILAVNLGFAIRATPGNVGLFQAMYALTAVGFGMDKDQAIGVAFLIQTQQIIPVILLGVAAAPEFIFKGKRAMRAEDEGLELHSRGETAVAG